MTSLPEVAALSALGMSAGEAARAIEQGVLDPPIEHPPGVFMWPRRSIITYLERHGKGSSTIAQNADKQKVSRRARVDGIGRHERS